MELSPKEIRLHFANLPEFRLSFLTRAIFNHRKLINASETLLNFHNLWHKLAIKDQILGFLRISFDNERGLAFCRDRAEREKIVVDPDVLEVRF